MHAVQLTSVQSQVISSELVTDLTYEETLGDNDHVLELTLPRLQASEEYVGEWVQNDPTPLSAYADVYCITNWAFTDWNGNVHGFKNVSACNVKTGAPPGGELEVSESADGSFYSLDTTNSADVKITSKDGTVYHFSYTDPFPTENGSYGGSEEEDIVDTRTSRMVDPNGNTVTVALTTNGGGTNTYTLTDTLQRSITITSNTQSGAGSMSYRDSNGSPQTISLSSQTAGPAGSSLTYDHFTGCKYNGKNQTGLYSNPTLFDDQPQTSSATSQVSLTFPAVGSDDTSKVFTFVFDAEKHLVQIFYPQGGYTRYVYNNYYVTGGATRMGNVTCLSPDNIQVMYRCQSTAATGISSGACSSPETKTKYVVNTFGRLPDIGANYSPFNASVSVTDEVGRVTTHNFTVQSLASVSALETSLLQYDSAGNLVRTTQTAYTAGAPFTELSYPQTVTTTWNDVSPNISSVVDYYYNDTYTAAFTPQGPETVSIDSPTETDEYDYDGSLKKKTAITWASSGYFSSNPHILDRPLSMTVTDAVTNLQNSTTYTYDNSANTLGNLTSAATGATNAPNATTSYVRDSYGRVTKATDPLNHPTNFIYDGSTDSNCDTSGSPFPTTITNALNQSATYQFNSCTGTMAFVVDPNGAKTSYSYDGIQRLIQTTFPDNGVDNISYVDSGQNSITDSRQQVGSSFIVNKDLFDGLGRKSQTLQVVGTNSIVYTDFTYDATGNSQTVSNPYYTKADSTYGVTTLSYLNTKGGYDPLGRVWTTTEQDNATKLYSYTGNLAEFYNENRSHWQRYYDAAGHLTKVIEPDPSAGTPALTTNYTYDGFGDLNAVAQLGKSGDTPRARTFKYDGLSRLLTAANPESGTVCYGVWSGSNCINGYDADGNLLNKTDARNVTITYSYDNLNRLIGKTYIVPSPVPAGYAATAPVTYTYDQGASNYYPIGHRTGMTDSAGQQSWTYDIMGRVRSIARSILTPVSNQSGNVNYTYNLDGSTNVGSFYAGTGFQYTYDAGGRKTGVAWVNNGTTFTNVSGGTYTADGQLAGLTQGGGNTITPAVTTSNQYNNRLQPTVLSASESGVPIFSHAFCYASCPGGEATTNNGNILQDVETDSQKTGPNYTPNLITVNFTYDELNRLLSAQSTTSQGVLTNWGDAYTYDSFGDLYQKTPIGSGMGESLVAIPTAKNQMSGIGLVYDANGNVITDNMGTQYTYDAESRIATAGTWSYSYDGDGNRVLKSQGGSTGNTYWYAADGTLSDEQSVSINSATGYPAQQQMNFYLNGKLLMRGATSQYPGYYILPDQIGSTRVTVDADSTGNTQGVTYYPFGTYVTLPTDTSLEQRFTGKERDTESGNDYFPKRYYSSAMGRWMSPDPIPWLGWQHPPEGSSEEEEEESHKKFEEWISDPQNFNMYAYVNNNPLNKTDPTGMAGCQAGDKKFSSCTITITYDPKTSHGTLTVTGINKGDKEATTLLTASVVVGGDGHVTPTGTFTAKSWEKDHVSTLYGNAANTPWSKTLLGGNAFGPYQLHIKELDGRGIMIHGTMGPSWSTKTWGNAIFLSPTSHGCVRMCNADDINLHSMMPNPAGNKIIIGTTP